MDSRLTEICDIDLKLEGYLDDKEINSEEIVKLVDKRDQILQNLLCSVEECPSLFTTEQWRDAITNTKRLIGLMQNKTEDLGAELKRYQYGKQSVQQYKKFL